MQEHLREALVTSYVRLSLLEDATFVLQKLCSTLGALYQRTCQVWSRPVSHILTCLVHNQYVPAGQSSTEQDLLEMVQREPTQILRGILLFLLTLVEDTHGRPSPGSTVVRHMSRSCSDVFAILKWTMDTLGVLHAIQDYGKTQSNSMPYLDPSLTLFRQVLQAVSLWIPLLKQQAEVVPSEERAYTSQCAGSCISGVIQSLANPDLTEVALQAMTSIQQSSPRLLMKADPGFPSSIINSNPIQRIASALLDGDFGTDAILLVDFLEAIMSQIDVTTPQYLNGRRYQDVLELLLSLLRCPGIAVVEDTVCQVVLETTSQIIEGYTDWSERGKADDFIREYAKQTCQACLTKIVLPDDELSRKTETWDRDDRTKYHSFVRDVQDFFQSAYSILGVSLVEAIVHSIAQPTAKTTWGEFEAGVTCLLAFSDTIASEPETYDQYVSIVLASDRFRLVLALVDVPDRPRSTCIKFLAGCTNYLQNHPELMQILNFLFSSLHLPTAAGGASRAIFSLCDTQRKSLTPALSDFLASLETINDLRGVEQQRIFGGVAAITQALTTEEAKIKPLQIMLLQIARECKLLSDSLEDKDSIAGKKNDILETLAAIGRGLRVPTDAPIESDVKDSSSSSFWTSGSGREIQIRVLDIYRTITEQIDQERDIMLIEAACQFLRSGFSEDHPSPFKFTSAEIVELITPMIDLKSGNISTVGECVSALLASEDREEFRPYLSVLLEPILGGLQQLLNTPDQSHAIASSDLPAAALNVVTRMLPKWSEMILESEDGVGLISVFIDAALAVISHPDTLPRRSAALFYSALVDVSKPNKSLSEVAQRHLQMVIRYRSQQIIASLIHLVGGECARSELDILTDPIRRFVQYQPMLFKTIAREAVSESNGILTKKALSATKVEDRLRFVAQLDLLKGARKTNDVVRDFWIACKGSSFDYIS